MNKIHFSVHDIRDRLSLAIMVQALVWLFVLGYSVMLVSLLHTNFILTIVFPPVIDRQQLVAHQEKVDRAGLSAVLQKDTTRRNAPDAHVNDPFVSR